MPRPEAVPSRLASPPALGMRNVRVSVIADALTSQTSAQSRGERKRVTRTRLPLARNGQGARAGAERQVARRLARRRVDAQQPPGAGQRHEGGRARGVERHARRRAAVAGRDVGDEAAAARVEHADAIPARAGDPELARAGERQAARLVADRHLELEARVTGVDRGHRVRVGVDASTRARSPRRRPPSSCSSAAARSVPRAR